MKSSLKMCESKSLLQSLHVKQTRMNPFFIFGEKWYLCIGNNYDNTLASSKLWEGEETKIPYLNFYFFISCMPNVYKICKMRVQ